MTDRLLCQGKQVNLLFVHHPRTLYRRRFQHSKRGAVPRSNDQFRTPLHTFAGSIDLSGLSFFALS
ncbi:MAG TPA: hypothetical protein VF205_01845, partial [Nitrospiraceae bacterium]